MARYPSFRVPTITRHSAPTAEMLQRAKGGDGGAAGGAKAGGAKEAAAAKAAKQRGSRGFVAPPTKTRFHLTTTQTALPLPTTFAAGVTLATHARPVDAPPLPPAAHAAHAAHAAYPYRFYQLTLRRGLFGLDGHSPPPTHPQAMCHPMCQPIMGG
ncbi:hypothetical protein HK100_001296 [Physocladia obscura]|uniref:Uncharacterized protein n=1 Tax=Physocladia obscura TaxID=109957 RepID=A0AAD5XB55_9FUNG|nr:hypothetical protein HK100_001296 [Physocladia obscura]